MPNTAQQRPDRRPILFVDVDGVISLFGFDRHEPPPGSFHSIDGMLHCIGHDVARRLIRLGDRFDLVWATGWEEKANEYLPHLIGVPELPTLGFDGRVAPGAAHWKLAAIEEFAGDRPAAWIDDSLDERCQQWANERPAPTLLVRTAAPIGIDEEHVETLLRFADGVERNREVA
ncbi:MAG: HAD domain-containing protein [Thermoleophilaceae bacterium]